VSPVGLLRLGPDSLLEPATARPALGSLAGPWRRGARTGRSSFSIGGRTSSARPPPRPAVCDVLLSPEACGSSSRPRDWSKDETGVRTWLISPLQGDACPVQRDEALLLHSSFLSSGRRRSSRYGFLRGHSALTSCAPLTRGAPFLVRHRYPPAPLAASAMVLRPRPTTRVPQPAHRLS